MKCLKFKQTSSLHISQTAGSKIQELGYTQATTLKVFALKDTAEKNKIANFLQKINHVQIFSYYLGNQMGVIESQRSKILRSHFQR